MPRKKGSVVVTFTFEGKRYSVSGKDKPEAERKKTLKLEALKSGSYIIESSMLVKDWVAVCYDKYKSNLSDGTLKKERSKVDKWIIGTIGNMPLKKVKPLDVQGILLEMSGKSDYYIKRIYQLLNWIFEKAVENDLIIKNPVKGVTRPKGTKTTRRAITDYEREHLLLVADKVPQLRFYLFMLFCGCRPSEVAELKGMDVQEINGTPMLHIRGTKTKNADRLVPIPDYLYQRLPDVSPFDYLFSTSSGRKLDEKARARLWSRCKRELNISMGCRVYRNQLVPPFPVAVDLTPYCFRHTYCTELAKAKVDIRTAKELMGHSDIKLTANIYTHVDNSMIVDVAKVINSHIARGNLRAVK